MPKQHIINFRVYYEDTDAGSVVYYANYFKFAERARTEMLRSMGIDHNSLAEEKNILFIVSSVHADFIKPAKLDDLLEIETSIVKLGGVRLEMQQNIGIRKENGEFENFVRMNVKIACITPNLRPARMPATLKSVLQEFLVEKV